MGVLNRALLAAAALQLVATGGAFAQNVSGAYVGIVKATHWPATKISLNVKQGGPLFPPGLVTAGYATVVGLRGTCSGYLFGNVAHLTCTNTVLVNGCSGQYYGQYTFSPGGMLWSFNGSDCRGFEEGSGTALKITQRTRARRHRYAK